MKKVWITLGVIAGVVVIGVMAYVSYYNRLVTLNESITADWSQVEIQLQRRLDLIPNLVKTVKGYAKHEREVFTNIADARAKLAGAKTVNDKVKAANEFEGALSRLLAIAENYPQLRASENFSRLQDELSGTENRVAVERRRYNETVQAFNILVRRFPSNLVAAMSGFERKEVYFESKSEAKDAPKVEF